MIITSSAFDDGGMIPKKFTCEGGDINPELLIQNVPAEARSLALILHDPDAPAPDGFTHWIVWNIDPRTTIIKDESTPPGSTEGLNSANKIGYLGPCPPSETPHHYHFRLYALDAVIGLSEDAGVKTFQKEIEEHIIASAELIGLYGRE